MDFENDEMEKLLANMATQAQAVYQQYKDMKEMSTEVRTTKKGIFKIGRFMVNFYNEYREHDGLTMAQTKELKKAQHYVTSEITRYLCPRLPESRKRGDAYLIEWNKVNKGLWSIFKTNVNGVSVPYDRTPKIKFAQALVYIKSLTVDDYLAYKDARWDDIRTFEYVESYGDEKMTLEDILSSVDNSDDDDNNNNGNGSPVLIH